MCALAAPLTHGRRVYQTGVTGGWPDHPHRAVEQKRGRKSHTPPRLSQPTGMGYNGLYTRDPGAPFACSEPISAGFGIGLFAAVTNKALWRIGRWHPSRLGGLGDGTETTIRHEAVVGETPCPENDCSTSRYDRSSLPAQHVHRRGSRLSNSAGRDQRQAQQG